MFFLDIPVQYFVLFFFNIPVQYFVLFIGYPCVIFCIVFFWISLCNILYLTHRRLHERLARNIDYQERWIKRVKKNVSLFETTMTISVWRNVEDIVVFLSLKVWFYSNNSCIYFCSRFEQVTCVLKSQLKMIKMEGHLRLHL